MRGFKRISFETITVLLDLRFVKSFLLLQFEGVLILINTEIIITKVVKTFILHDALIFSLIRELCIFFFGPEDHRRPQVQKCRCAHF